MDVPLIKDTETKHILILGDDKQGKTDAIENLLNQLKNEKVIIIDAVQESPLVQKYYTPRDHLMNPFDSRFPFWQETNTTNDHQTAAIEQRINKLCAAHLKPIQSQNQTPFSIQQWLLNPDETSWLFFSLPHDKLQTYHPLLSYWLSLAIKTLMKPNNHQQKIVWIVINDLLALDKLPELTAWLSANLSTNTTSPFCIVLGIPDITLWKEKYDRPQEVEHLFKSCATKIIFRQANYKNAAQIASWMNTNKMQAGMQHSIISQQKIVYPQTLVHLPDFVSYVELPQYYPRIHIEWRK